MAVGAEQVRTQEEATAERFSPKLLDKYVLPKVALTVIIVASAAGILLSGLRGGQSALGPLAVKWIAFLALAAWTGTLFWRTLILPAAIGFRPTATAVGYGLSQIARFRRLEGAVVPLVLVATGWSLYLINLNGAAHFDPATQVSGWAQAAAVTLLGALGIMHLGRPAAPADLDELSAERRRSTVLLILCLGLITANAFVEVSLQEAAPTWPLVLNRWIHLAAFSVWFGGAIWNIFIAVPSGRERLHLDTIIAANAQLERFRWTVRFILPAILATGLIQAYQIVGLNLAVLTGSVFGWFILFKLGTIAALVVIFITCPMWRACSPVAGVCNLDDIMGEDG